MQNQVHLFLTIFFIAVLDVKRPPQQIHILTFRNFKNIKKQQLKHELQSSPLFSEEYDNLNVHQMAEIMTII